MKKFMQQFGIWIAILGLFASGVKGWTIVNVSLQQQVVAQSKMENQMTRNQSDHDMLIKVLSDMQINMMSLCDKNGVKYYQSVDLRQRR